MFASKFDFLFSWLLCNTFQQIIKYIIIFLQFLWVLYNTLQEIMEYINSWYKDFLNLKHIKYLLLLIPMAKQFTDRLKMIDNNAYFVFPE